MRIERKTAAAVAILLGLLFSILFYGKAPGVSLPLFLAAAYAALVLSSGGPFKLSQFLAASGSLALAGFFTLRDAPELRLVDLWLSVYLFLLAFGPWLRRRALEDFDMPDYLFLPLELGVQSIGKGTGELRELYAQERSSETPYRRIGIAILMALPILAVFVILMSQADMMFEALSRGVREFVARHVFEGLARTVLTLLAGAFFAGLLAWRREPAPSQGSAAAEPRSWRFLESAVVLGLVDALFLVFTIIQIIFLLGGEARIQALGITYSEYARKGFWEMIVIALVALALAVILDEKVAPAEGTQKTLHKAGLCLLSAMTGVLMVSAFYRLWLYEQAYGFTILRFYSHTFIAYIAAVFAFLSLKVLREQSRQVFLYRCFLATILLFVGWNAANPHRLIARVNVDRALAGERELDVNYLLTLSYDAVPEMAASLPLPMDDTVRLRVKNALSARKFVIEQERLSRPPWQSAHWRYRRAWTTLRDLPL